jgi:membrane-associated protease RseP (regulator of RpoE activity)
MRILAIVGVVLALAAGAMIAVAATDDDPDTDDQQVAQETAAPETDVPEEDDDQDDEQAAKAWIGVVVAPADGGLVIKQVSADGPAAQAGLAEDDTITAINGTTVTTQRELKRAIVDLDVGSEVTLTVIKSGSEGGETTDVTVVLAARPDKGEIWEGLEGAFQERFDRFLGGTFRYLDDEGNEIEIETVPGTITAISDTEITLDVNGDEGERTFSIGEDARVSDGLEAGNRVVVMLENGELTAVHGGHFPFLPGGFGGFHKFEGIAPGLCDEIESDGDQPRIERFCHRIEPDEEEAEPTPEA